MARSRVAYHSKCLHNSRLHANIQNTSKLMPTYKMPTHNLPRQRMPIKPPFNMGTTRWRHSPSVDQVFKLARALAPSVVFVEEVQRVWGKASKGAADGNAQLKKPLAAAIKVHYSLLDCTKTTCSHTVVFAVMKNQSALYMVDHIKKYNIFMSSTGPAARGACCGFGDVLTAARAVCCGGGPVLGPLGGQAVCGTPSASRPPPGVPQVPGSSMQTCFDHGISFISHLVYPVLCNGLVGLGTCTARCIARIGKST